MTVDVFLKSDGQYYFERAHHTSKHAGVFLGENFSSRASFFIKFSSSQKNTSLCHLPSFFKPRIGIAISGGYCHIL